MSLTPPVQVLRQMVQVCSTQGSLALRIGVGAAPAPATAVPHLNLNAVIVLGGAALDALHRGVADARQRAPTRAK